jgi:hypothetical protein
MTDMSNVITEWTGVPPVPPEEIERRQQRSERLGRQAEREERIKRAQHEALTVVRDQRRELEFAEDELGAAVGGALLGEATDAEVEEAQRAVDAARVAVRRAFLAVRWLDGQMGTIRSDTFYRDLMA